MLVITFVGNSFDVHTQDYVNDTFETNGHSYEINHILENFNVFSFGNVTGSHINGAIIAGGGAFKIPEASIDLNVPKWDGSMSDDGFSISDFADPVPRNYSYIQGSYKTVTGFDLLDRLYVGKKANEGIENNRLSHKKIIFTDDYVNWSLAKENLQAQSIEMLSNAERDLTLDDIYRDPHGVPYIIVKENDNLRISQKVFDEYKYIVYASEDKPFDTDRIILNYEIEGTVYEKFNVFSNNEQGLRDGTVLMSSLIHSLAYDGYHPNGPQVTGPEKTINIFHNYPYATNIINLNDWTQRFGQLVAVNANVFDLLGNVNGNMIVKALYSHNSEPHFWPPGKDFEVKPDIKLYEINGIKIDEEDKTVLSGAIITLFDNENNIIDSTTTDEKGFFAFKNLEEGTYVVKETKAPEGYELGDNTVTITVNNETELIPLLFKNKKIEEKIPKDIYYFINGYKRDSLNKEPLQGAEITLFDKDGETLDSMTTDADGYFEFSNLKAGSYIIEETKAPDGYELGNNKTEVTFSHESEQSLTLEYFNSRIEEEIPKVTLYNIKGIKIDSDTKETLSGAEITLYDKYGQKLDSVVTQENGRFEFDNLVPGTYFVEETKAPEGYFLGNNYVEIIITEDYDYNTLVFENSKIDKPPTVGGRDPKPKDPDKPILESPGEVEKPVKRKTQRDKPTVHEDISTPNTGINNPINNILYVSIISASVMVVSLLRNRKSIKK